KWGVPARGKASPGKAPDSREPSDDPEPTPSRAAAALAIALNETISAYDSWESLDRGTRELRQVLYAYSTDDSGLPDGVGAKIADLLRTLNNAVASLAAGEQLRTAVSVANDRRERIITLLESLPGFVRGW